MVTRTVVSRCVAWVVMAVAALGTQAQPLADRVPGDALMYVAWGGAEKGGPGFAGSHLEGFLKDSDVPKLVNETIPAFLQTIGQKDPQAGQVTMILSALGGPLWRNPSAFYFGGYDRTNPQKPMPKFAILCDAGAEGARFADVIKNMIQATRPPYEIKVEEANGRVAIHSGIAGYAANAKPADALAASAKFKAAQAQVGKDAFAVAYVDVEGVIGLMDAMVPAGRGQQEWGKVRDSIGLTGIKRAIFTAGFDGKEWASRGFIDSPAAARKGIVAQLMSSKPLDEDFYAAIPATSNSAMGGRFDLGGLVNAIKAAIVQAEPRAGEEFDKGIAQVREMTGVDVQKDLLDALGDQWAVYTDPMGGGNGLMGMVVVNKPRDAAKLEASVGKLEDVANNIIRQQMGRQKDGPVIEIRRSTARGVNLHYVGLPLFSPTWAVSDGYWYAGLSPQAVVGAAEHVKSKGTSIKDNASFAALRKRLGDRPATGFVFADLPKTAPDSYSQSLMFARLVLGAADLFGANTPPLTLPTLKQLMPHLTVAGGVSWIDDAGWHSHAVEPFPGATMLASGGGAQAVVGTQALAASILLPSLNKARESANRVKCASNLRQIGMGIILYANDNKGKYPPNLGTLVTSVELSPQVFMCPTHDHGAPAIAPGGAGGAKQLAEWVDENSAYVYLGAGLNNTTPADVIVVHEKPGNHAGGMNCLFGDGHVEWLMMPQAMEQIEKSKEWAAKKRGGK
ncbi:MAG TPA: DUF3352 domain-containing protein [Tepidisphaeraceae bacterium]|nr:DUF3352 domain-containing protein [Tepidisphaeraceae bacterium]